MFQVCRVFQTISHSSHTDRKLNIVRGLINLWHIFLFPYIYMPSHMPCRPHSLTYRLHLALRGMPTSTVSDNPSNFEFPKSHCSYALSPYGDLGVTLGWDGAKEMSRLILIRIRNRQRFRNFYRIPGKVEFSVEKPTDIMCM